MKNKPMVAQCPMCGEKFRDPLLFIANLSMQEHLRDVHPSSEGSK